MLDQRWASLVERLGGCPVPLASCIRDPEAYLDALAIDGLIMTGGNDIATLPDANDTAPERDSFESAAYAYCLEKRIPVLGVCRGAQMINLLAGGRLERIANHVALRHAVTWSPSLPQVWDCPAEVNSYHGWGIAPDGLALGFVAAARADDGSIEAFYAADAAVTGIVWHPEREDALSDEAVAFLARTLCLGNDAPKMDKPA